MTMALPWLILSGKRHVDRLSLKAPLRRHRSSFYRFFSHFKFRRELFFKILLKQIVTTLQLKTLRIAVDDTLCPKWGKKIFGTGTHWDHVHRPRPGYIWGHDWVVLAVVFHLFGVPVALPFWVELYLPEKICKKGTFRTRLQMTVSVLKLVQTWFPDHPIEVLADGAYNNVSTLKPFHGMKIPLISRLRLDATLRKDPPKSRKGKRGRKPRYGVKYPTLSAMAKSPNGWTNVKAFIYGKTVRLRVKCFDAWWSKSGVKLRIVMTQDADQKRPVQFFSSTNLELSSINIIERFALRWPIEQLFSDAKLLIGLDSAEVRKEHSVLRHAIFTFALVTWTRLWAYKHLKNLKQPPVSFAGQLTKLRQSLLRETIFAAIPGKQRSKRIAMDLACLLAA